VLLEEGEKKQKVVNPKNDNFQIFIGKVKNNKRFFDLL